MPINITTARLRGLEFSTLVFGLGKMWGTFFKVRWGSWTLRLMSCFLVQGRSKWNGWDQSTYAPTHIIFSFPEPQDRTIMTDVMMQKRMVDINIPCSYGAKQTASLVLWCWSFMVETCRFWELATRAALTCKQWNLRSFQCKDSRLTEEKHWRLLIAKSKTE